MLVSSHNDILQDLQEIRIEFLQKIFRKLNMKNLSNHSWRRQALFSGIFWKFCLYSEIIKVFIKSLTYKLQESAKYSFHKHYILIYIDLSRRCYVGVLVCFLRFNRLFWTRRWFIISKEKLWTFIFLEEDLTMLPHDPHQTNQGSIWFHSFTSFTFMSSFEHWGQCSS